MRARSNLPSASRAFALWVLGPWVVGVAASLPAPALAEVYVLAVEGEAKLEPSTTLNRPVELRPGMKLDSNARLQGSEETSVRILCGDFSTTRSASARAGEIGAGCPTSPKRKWNPMRGDEDLAHPLLLAPRGDTVEHLRTVRWTSTLKKGPFRVSVVDAETGAAVVEAEVKKRDRLEGLPRELKNRVYWFSYALEDAELAKLERGKLYAVEVTDLGGASSKAEHSTPVRLAKASDLKTTERLLRDLDAKVPANAKALFRARYLAHRELESDAFDVLEHSDAPEGLNALARIDLVIRRGQPPEAWGREIYRALLVGLADKDPFVIMSACRRYIEHRSILSPAEGASARRIGEVLQSKASQPYADLCPSR